MLSETEREARARAKPIFHLRPGVDWDELSDEEQDAFARAIFERIKESVAAGPRGRQRRDDEAT